MGRPAVQDFDKSERLFYRLSEHYPEGAAPLGLSVRSPDFSVNREKHGGQPDFVLRPNWLDHGIAAFVVGRIPGPIPSGGGISYSWKVFHVPLEENYHHSEVTTYRGDVPCRNSSQVNDLVKREFRQRLAEAMIVIRSSLRPR